MLSGQHDTKLFSTLISYEDQLLQGDQLKRAEQALTEHLARSGAPSIYAAHQAESERNDRAAGDPWDREGDAWISAFSVREEVVAKALGLDDGLVDVSVQIEQTAAHREMLINLPQEWIDRFADRLTALKPEYLDEASIRKIAVERCIKFRHLDPVAAAETFNDRWPPDH